MNERSIFESALDIPDPRQRAAYLDNACGQDPQLRRHLDDLFAAEGRLGSFLAGAPVVTDATSGYEPITERIGSLIGPYKLMEQIGEGGMGLVFVAEQQEPVRRKVALKLIKPGMDTREVIARFEAERQALALMDHPNIARVLDAGATESGRPYFVMELVKGIPITDYCDQNQRTLAERLELIISVCQAVQHAHAKGVIHRDLKPSNILIAPHDGKPVVKVIDFGVAKAIGQPLTDKTIYTRLTQIIGTPLYMSPEQAEINALDVDTRGDVYALGVLLYELLTGTTPFDRERFGTAAFDEIRRIIREEEPPRPSTRLSTLGDAMAAVSAKRKLEPAKLSALVCGDLDWIVMKCLEKDRTRRYETATGLARDVERYLKDEPVEACPPTAGYKLRKFARKNRRLLATAAALALMLLLGAAASAWQAVRATKAEAAAEANERQANDNAGQAREKEQEANKERDEVKALNQKLQETQIQLRRTVYADDMNLAQHAWDSGRLARALDLLEKHRPKAEETDLRGFEWDYLNRLCHSEVLTLMGHTGSIPADRSVAFSPDGKRLASGFKDLTVKVWDAQTGKELATCKGHTGSVIGVAFSPDGKRLASASFDSTVKVWDAQTGKELHSIKVEGVNRTVVFSPDGKRIAGTSNDEKIDDPFGAVNGTVKVWDAQSGDALLTLKGHTGIVWGVCFSPDGKSLASASYDQTVKLWDAETGKELQTLKHVSPAHSVAFSPDGKRLASGTGELGGGVKLWEAETGKELFTINTYTEQVNCVAFSPDGKRLVSGANDNKVKIWDAQTGRELRTFVHTALVESVVFNPEGSRLAAASYNGTVKIWDLTATLETRAFTGHTTTVLSLAYSPDGKRLASGDGWDATKRDYVAGEVKVSDALTGKELVTCKGHTGAIFNLAFSADGKRLVSGSWVDNTVKVWDADTGKELRSLTLGPNRPKGSPLFVNGLLAVTISPDGKRLATVAYESVEDKEKKKVILPDGKEVERQPARRQLTVKVWDANTGKELQCFKGVGRRAVFSPDGKRLANGGNGEVTFWDADTGKELFGLKGENRTGSGSAYGDVAFSADGKWLASTRMGFPGGGPPGWGEVRVSDAQTGAEHCTLKGLTGHLTSVVFSPDGGRVATADWWDNNVKVWDAHTGLELLTFAIPVEQGKVESLAFSPDGKRLVSNVMMWDATPPQKHAE